MNCPYCGAVLKETDNFCTACGVRVRRQTVEAPARTAPRTPSEQPKPRPRKTALEPAPDRGAVQDRARGGVEGARVPAGGEVRDDALAEARRARVEALSPDPKTRRATDPWSGVSVPESEPEPIPVPAPRPAASEKSWSSGFATVLCVAACLLAVLAALMLVFTPIVELPLLGGSAATSSELVHAVLVSVDPGLSVFMSRLLDVEGLCALDLVGVGASLADALGNPTVAVGFGVALGLAAVAAVLALVGALASVVLRRPTPVLCVSCALLCLLGAGGCAGAVAADDRLVGVLRNDLSSAFAELGVQLPAAAQMLAPTVWLVAVAACGLAALVLALWARARQNADRLGV